MPEMVSPASNVPTRSLYFYRATLCYRGATTFSKLGVQFLGYCTEQNTDGIPSFVHCSLLRNGNHTLHQKSWGCPSKFGGPDPPPPPSSCALDTDNYVYVVEYTIPALFGRPSTGHDARQQAGHVVDDDDCEPNLTSADYATQCGYKKTKTQ